MNVLSDAAPRLLQENQRYLSQLTSLMQEAADEQSKSIVVSSCWTRCYSQTRLSISDVPFSYLFTRQILKNLLVTCLMTPVLERRKFRVRPDVHPSGALQRGGHFIYFCSMNHIRMKYSESSEAETLSTVSIIHEDAPSFFFVVILGFPLFSQDQDWSWTKYETLTDKLKKRNA